MNLIDDIKMISIEAGEIARKGFNENVSIEYKTDASNIVTNIDKDVETKIIEFVQKKYPTHSILAEESGELFKSSEYIWVIDPIDGTTNFAHKLPIFGVSIGVRKNYETIVGVVYDVMRDVMYSAEKGSGSYLNNKKIKVSDNSVLEKGVFVTGFSYDRGDEYTKALKIFGNFLNNSRAVRRLGSAALDLCYVASGVFDGFWEENLSPWDVCAGMLLVEEAGGKTTDFTNNEIDINHNQFLSSNGIIHNEMIKIINSI